MRTCPSRGREPGRPRWARRGGRLPSSPETRRACAPRSTTPCSRRRSRRIRGSPRWCTRSRTDSGGRPRSRAAVRRSSTCPAPGEVDAVLGRLAGDRGPRGPRAVGFLIGGGPGDTSGDTRRAMLRVVVAAPPAVHGPRDLADLPARGGPGRAPARPAAGRRVGTRPSSRTGSRARPGRCWRPCAAGGRAGLSTARRTRRRASSPRLRGRGRRGSTSRARSPPTSATCRPTCASWRRTTGTRAPALPREVAGRQVAQWKVARAVVDAETFDRGASRGGRVGGRPRPHGRTLRSARRATGPRASTGTRCCTAARARPSSRGSRRCGSSSTSCARGRSAPSRGCSDSSADRPATRRRLPCTTPCSGTWTGTPCTSPCPASPSRRP